MYKVLSLTVLGEPVSKLVAQPGKPHWFTPAKTLQQMELIRLMWKLEVRDRFDGKVPLELGAIFVFDRAPSTVKKDGSPKAGQPIQYIKKPDNSNLIKLVEDALNPKQGFGGAYDDDSQIVRYAPRNGKYFTDLVDGVDEPCTIITLRELSSTLRIVV